MFVFKITLVNSRTTGPNIGLFVLHFDAVYIPIPNMVTTCHKSEFCEIFLRNFHSNMKKVKHSNSKYNCSLGDANDLCVLLNLVSTLPR